MTHAKFVSQAGKTLFIVGQDLNTVDEYSRTVGIDLGGVTTSTSLKRLEGITEKADDGSGILFMDGLVKSHPDSALVVGLNVVDALNLKTADAVVNFARQHSKPVMLAESTPQGYDNG